MGQGRPTGASYGAAHATITLDLSSIQAAPRVAQAAGEATAKALQQSLKIVQNEQKIAVANAQQAAAAAQAQQAQVTATAKAESAERIAQARSEAAVTQQQARAATASIVEEQRRQTAAFKQELKERDRAQRQQTQVSAGSFARGAASFAGAAIGGPIGGLVGAAISGNPAIAAGLAVNQGARFAIEADKVAVAYNRQNLAALQLAGSQSKLNDLMATYDKDSGGVLDKTQEIADVTKLESLGFADSAKQLDAFTRAARGISLSQNKPQGDVNEQLTQAIISQRRQSLRDLGLEFDQVKAREAELQQADKSLTNQQAYGQAVIEQAIQKFGGLAKSGAGARSGIEAVGTEWQNLRLQIAQEFHPSFDKLGQDTAAFLEWLQQRRAAIPNEAANLYRSIGIPNAPVGQQARDIGRHPETGGLYRAPAIDPNADAIQAVHLNWAQGITDLDAKTHAAIIDEETSFGESRAKTVADYNKSVARDEASYARSRLRQNLDQLDALASVAKDATRREQHETTDLARTMAAARADAAEHDANARKESNKQLAKLDENYEKERLKNAKELSNKLLDAAGQLDAKQVYQLQRDAALQQKEAADAHTDARKEIQGNLKDRLADEAKSLAKSLAQQQDAYDRQISEGRANDALKLQDMKDAFAKSQARAAEDHGIEVAQRAQDQADELTAMDAQHNLRLSQIAIHAQADRDALDEQAKIDLLALGVRNAAWQKVEDAKEAHREKLWNDFMARVNGTLLQGRPDTPQMVPGFASGGYVDRGGLARVHAGEFMLSRGMLSGQQAIPAAVSAALSGNTNNSRSINFQPGSVVVYAAAGEDAERIAYRVIDMINEHIEYATHA